MSENAVWLSTNGLFASDAKSKLWREASAALANKFLSVAAIFQTPLLLLKQAQSWRDILSIRILGKILGHPLTCLKDAKYPSQWFRQLLNY